MLSGDIRAAVAKEESTVAGREAGPAKLVVYLLTRRNVQAVAAYRAARWLGARGLGPLGYVLSLLAQYATGAELSPAATIGERLVLTHPQGIVIAGGVTVGADLHIHTGCVLGFQTGHGGGNTGTPTLGDRVLLGAGAKVIGPRTIGDDARVGANAVVLIDVPPGAAVGGVPAKLL